MQRKTEMYPRAWLAHHALQYGQNWPRVSHLFFQKEEMERRAKEAPMNTGG